MSGADSVDPEAIQRDGDLALEVLRQGLQLGPQLGGRLLFDTGDHQTSSLAQDALRFSTAIK